MVGGEEGKALERAEALKEGSKIRIRPEAS